MTPDQYDVLLRRMKLLSKTQACFLKQHLEKKVSGLVALVERSMACLESMPSSPGNAAVEARSIKEAMDNLKLAELSVDASAKEVELNKELHLLRSSTNGNITPLSDAVNSVFQPSHSPDNAASASAEVPTLPPPAPTADSSQGSNWANNNETIKTLTTENIELKKKLEEALAQAAEAAKVVPSVFVSDGATISTKVAEGVAAVKRKLEAEHKAALDSVSKKYSTEKDEHVLLMAQKNKEVMSLNDEISALMAASRGGEEAKSAIAKLEKQLAEARQAQAAAEATLEKSKSEAASSISEATSAADSKVKAKYLKKSDEDAAAAARNLKSELEALRKELTEAGEAKLKAAIAETEARMEAEKDEMMEAMAQEVDEVETTKDAEIAEAVEAAEVRERYLQSESGTLLNTMRRKLHNTIQELKGNIRVYMRCRPPSSKEIEQLGEDANCNREKAWEFDETDVSGLVTSAMDGYNVCIFAYGQTGSGKTFTMAGPPGDRGVNTRALSELFEKSAARQTEMTDTISLSILEVYNEEIRDLLTNDHQDKLECEVHSIEDVDKLFLEAEKHRATATTNMNEHSTGQQMRGKLNLVDLAGSERIARSGATGQALKEAQNINKSLSALGDVIAARANKQGHIPFRNSTLTYLLQDSLSKDSKTLMICCISPTLDSAEETYCSLNFAARVNSVELGKASKNAVVPAGGNKASSRR
eukprot:GSChrysophyteH1.ASY1.ANO1.2760.1 assembled CDS